MVEKENKETKFGVRMGSLLDELPVSESWKKAKYRKVVNAFVEQSDKNVCQVKLIGVNTLAGKLTIDKILEESKYKGITAHRISGGLYLSRKG